MALAEAALPQAASILHDLIGGKQVGREWLAPKKSAGGPGDSWSFNLDDGVWSHFASGAKGHDLVGFLAGIWGLNQGPAADRLAAHMGWQGRSNGANPPPVRTLPTQAPPERPTRAEIIPPDAPPLYPHPKFGQATHEYRYGDHFIVARYEFLNGDEPDKTFHPWVWRHGGWVRSNYGDNAPLFHVEQLAKCPNKPVLIVEGEKCVEACAPLLESHVVVTWNGGAPNWKKSDWSVLKGRDVLIWPDADDPGRKAAADLGAHLAGIAHSVRTVNPNGADPGWDVADAILVDQWDAKHIAQWADEHAVDTVKPPDTNPELAISAPAPVSHLVSLASLDLKCINGIPVPSIANVSKILRFHPEFKGNIWFDTFRGAIYHAFHGRPQRWTDAETRALTVRIQEALDLPKFSTSMVQEGLQHAAEQYRRNSLTEYLDGLVWDGNSRLDSWLDDCAGVARTDYTLAVARNWPIAMVARAYDPGCKMDNMPVLEGVSGLRKTQFLGVLGGEWYKALSMQFGEKDFLQALRGAWLIEIPDMAGFKRAEHSKVLAVITTAVDSYRVPYGRESEDVPRTCIFAATSETDDYLADSRGKRRYWPLRCTDINLEALRSQRDHIFAEAVQRYREGAHWYDMPGSAAQEQIERTIPDEWVMDVLDKAEVWWERYAQSTLAVHKVTAKRILHDSLGVEFTQINEAQCRRVANILLTHGWYRKRDTYGWYYLKKDVLS